MNQERTVYAKLREQLLNGEFTAGQRLTEQFVCDQLGVSRTPVRAALLRLEAQGLVIGRNNRGYTVCGITVRDVRDANVVRATLEGTAAGLLAREGPDAALRDRLEESVAAYDALAAQVELTDAFLDRHAAVNRDFHDTLISATGNESLARSIRPLAYMPVQISRVVFSRDAGMAARTLRAGAQDHRAVLAAILAGDAMGAELLMRTHSQTALRGIEALRAEAGLGAEFLDMPFHDFLGKVGGAG